MACTASNTTPYPQALWYLEWVTDTPQVVRVERVLPDAVTLAEVQPGVSFYVDNITGITDPDTPVEWTLFGLTDTTTVTVSGLAEPSPYTYGTVDMLADAPRYADMDAVKKRIGVEDTSWDTEVTQAIIAAETTMDVAWGRSFPDTGINPRWPGIPVQVTQAAENIAIAVLNQTDAPFGVAGSDAFALGEIDIDDLVRKELYRSPLLRSFNVAAGYGMAR